VPDFALFLELGVQGKSGFYLAERLGGYRVHPAQQTRNRIELARDQARVLRALRSNHELEEAVDRLAGQRYREAVIELAIAYAHKRHRWAALQALNEYGDLGWGLPHAGRIAVLAALLAGARKRPARDAEALAAST
jgi:hypothetical protein